MQENERIIEQFYTAFSQKDYLTMIACYSDDIVFSDPAFGLLQGNEVKSMWEMLCKKSKDLQLQFSNITSIDEEYYTCNWVASYTFSPTGNKVTNRIKAFMRIKNGKIIEHSDAFRFSTWAGQALGWKGKFFGWTNFMKRIFQKKARKNLETFMLQKQQ